MLLRALVLVLTILAGFGPAQASTTFSGLPPAAQPVGSSFDAVPLDQGSGCSTNSQPCTTVQTPSLRLGQPLVQNCATIVSPFQYEQCFNTTTTPATLQVYVGTGWLPIIDYAGAGNFITGPTTSTIGDCAFWENTAGNLLGDVPCGGATVANNAALQALPTTLIKSVVRLGFTVTGDAPPWYFSAQIGTCASNVMISDGGSCVDATGGNSWLAILPPVLDAREWGVHSLNFSISSSGSDTNNFCLVNTSPCLTLPHAVQQVAKFAFNLNTNGASITDVTASGSSTFSGATVAGHFLNASGNSVNPCLFINGRGDASSATPTHITADGGNPYNIETSGNACLSVQNVDLVIAAGSTGLFAQDGGTHLSPGGRVSCTGPSSGTEAQACMHAEGGAYIEVPTSPPVTITTQGKFAWSFTIGATPAKLAFDGGGTLACGSGLTLDPAGGSFLVVASSVNIASGLVWDPSCNGIAGHPVVATNGSLFSNLGGTIPNTGSYEFLDTSRYSPDPGIGLGACTGGGGSGAIHAGSTIYDGQIDFSGLTLNVPSCNVRFGIPGGIASSWFTAAPFCTVTEIEGVVPATKWANVENPTTLGFTVVGSSSFGNTESFVYHCNPSNNG